MKVTKAGDKKDTAVAGATMVSAGGSKPVPLMLEDINVTGKESFLDREAKFARRWLFSKGLMVQEERKNPVDVELESFFQNCKDLQKPKADIEVGMADSIAVMLSNQAMDENRRVYFNEIEKWARPPRRPSRRDDRPESRTRLLTGLLGLSLLPAGPSRRDGEAQPLPQFSKSPRTGASRRLPMPPPFAPGVKLTGFEEARFAPGMFDTSSANYFTYVLVITADGDQGRIAPELRTSWRNITAG